MQVYVDDLIMLVAGEPQQGQRLHALFLLWVLFWGPAVSQAKVDRGQRVSWC